MNDQNHQWYLRIQGDKTRYPVDYSVYHLTDGTRNFEVHEIEYNEEIVTKESQLEAIVTIGKIIRKERSKK